MNDLIERLNHLKNLDPERYRYTLNSLARHLSEADNYPRLRMLFNNHDWLHIRFEGDMYVYDGYLDDLDLAWEKHAYPEALRQIDLGVVPYALVDCFRYALIRTSINSVATSYSPELAIKAVEMQLWSTQRALSVIRHIPDPGKRFESFSALIATSKLNKQQLNQVLQEAFNIIPQILANPRHVIPIDAIAHHMTQNQIQYVVEVVLANTNFTDAQVQALATLSQHINGDLAENILKMVLTPSSKINNTSIKILMLKRLLPNLRDSDLEKKMDSYLSINLSDPLSFDHNHEILILLKPYLNHNQIQRLVNYILSVDSIYLYPKILEEFVAHLNEENIQDLLETIFDSLKGHGSHFNINTLSSLASLFPYLNQNQINQTYTRLRANPLYDNSSGYDEFGAMTRLIPYLDGKNRGEACSIVLKDILSTIKYISNIPEFQYNSRGSTEQAVSEVAERASIIAPLLNKRDLRKLVNVIRKIHSPYPRGIIIAKMADWLEDDFLEEAIIALWRAYYSYTWYSRRDGLDVIWEFNNLIPKMNLNQHHSFLMKIRNFSSRNRIEAEIVVIGIKMLIPFLNTEQKKEAFEIVTEVINESDRADGLIAMIPYVNEELIHWVLDTAMTFHDPDNANRLINKLVPYLNIEQVGRVLVWISAVRDLDERVSAQFALENYQTIHKWGKPGMRGISALAAIHDVEVRNAGLSSIQAEITEESLKWALQEMLKKALILIGSETNIEPLATLIPFLEEPDLHKATEALLNRVMTIEFYKEGAVLLMCESLKKVLSYFDKEQIQLLLENVLRSDPDEDYFPMEVLTVIAPYLDQKQLEKGFEFASPYRDPYYRVRALASLIPHMNGIDQKQALKVVFKSARDVPWNNYVPGYVAQTYQNLRPYFDDESRWLELRMKKVLEDAPGTYINYCLPDLSVDQHYNGCNRALNMLTKGNYDSIADVIISLIPFLDKPQLLRALEITLSSQNERDFDLVIPSLVSRLDDDQIQAVIINLSNKIKGLHLLVNYLDHLVQQALFPNKPKSELTFTEKTKKPAIVQIITNIFRFGVFLPVKSEDSEKFPKMKIRQIQLRAQIQQEIVNNLFVFRNEQRSALLIFCSDHNLFKSSVIPRIILGSIAENILEICWMWIWQ